MDGDVLSILVASWVVCGIAGAIVGSAKNAGAGGFVLGLLLGPIGVIAAFSLDGRRQCPKCGTRLNAGASVCPQCGGEVDPGSQWGPAPLPRAMTDDLESEERAVDRLRQARNLPPRSE